MRIVPTTATAAIAFVIAQPAAAHPGHLADAAGHDHWVAGAALGLALAAALWAALRGRTSPNLDDTASDESADPAIEGDTA